MRPCVQCHADLDAVQPASFGGAAPPSVGQRVCPFCRALQPAERLSVTPGATIDLGYGRVVVDTRVGEGGMGVVYRAWLFHNPAGARGGEPPEPIALKVLRAQGAVKTELRTFFLNEARALRKLSHPNIVRFHDLFDWGSSLCLAIEYVEGDTLEDVIARHVARARLAGAGALPGIAFRRAWYYFEQLLGALAAIHALGIVHRDVKPSNILIRKDGIVKLTDFGIARLLGTVPGEAGKQPTQGFAPGTGLYMSPEQVLSQPIDGRSDLYSAAIVLYEMLSGRTPFDADKSEFLVRQDQVQAAPPPIRTWLAQAPPIIDALFARALAKDPAYRFSDAIEMGNAFREALGIRETPEWRAQAEIAREAKPSLAPTQLGEGQEEQKHAQRIATLREFVVKGYKTMKMASM